MKRVVERGFNSCPLKAGQDLGRLDWSIMVREAKTRLKTPIKPHNPLIISRFSLFWTLLTGRPTRVEVPVRTAQGGSAVEGATRLRVVHTRHVRGGYTYPGCTGGYIYQGVQGVYIPGWVGIYGSFSSFYGPQGGKRGSFLLIPWSSGRQKRLILFHSRRVGGRVDSLSAQQ